MQKTATKTQSDNAQFLDLLAVFIAQDLKPDGEALVGHLDGMTGTEGAYLCFALMNLLAKRGDDEGTGLVMRVISEGV